mmetsp:Transcript_45881/g.121275  ORF Transcript_45881/g.121275 Transcript_45881/m.121275 type:complete len:325 (+) Transcript_45881:2923-3897(+)
MGECSRNNLLTAWPSVTSHFSNAIRARMVCSSFMSGSSNLAIRPLRETRPMLRAPRRTRHWAINRPTPPLPPVTRNILCGDRSSRDCNGGVTGTAARRSRGTVIHPFTTTASSSPHETCCARALSVARLGNSSGTSSNQTRIQGASSRILRRKPHIKALRTPRRPGTDATAAPTVTSTMLVRRLRRAATWAHASSSHILSGIAALWSASSVSCSPGWGTKTIVSPAPKAAARCASSACRGSEQTRRAGKTPAMASTRALCPAMTPVKAEMLLISSCNSPRLIHDTLYRRGCMRDSSSFAVSRQGNGRGWIPLTFGGDRCNGVVL